jgi:chorismate mutase-like protein
MNADKPLDALRQEIDAIDDAIHDLIMARTKVVEQVREAKREQSVKIRPARECSIMYRLMERHKGPFPKRELARMWRELIVAALSFEGLFSVGVHMPDASRSDEPCREMYSGHWNMVRDQYGAFTPMHRYPSAGQLIDAVRRHDVTIGVLSIPEQAEGAPWWPLLASQAKNTPRIINRLPFIGVPEDRGTNIEALVICPVPSEPTGRDHTFLVVEAADEISLQRLSIAFKRAGIKTVFMSVWRDTESSPCYKHLAEVEGFITDKDSIILRLRESLYGTASSIYTIGSYGQPLTFEDLETR